MNLSATLLRERTHPGKAPPPAVSHHAVLGLCLLLLTWLSTPSLRGGDWLQFRGPGSRAIAEESALPIALDAKTTVAWKIPLPGRGLASPILVGDRIFLTASSGPRQERLHVLCFRAQDGHLLWERRFWATGRTMTHEKTCVAAPTPASDGRRLFVLFSSNDLLCLDLQGNVLWVRGLTSDYPNVSNSLGMASSPLLAGGVLVVQVENDSDSWALGIDAGTGMNRWKKARPKAANWSSPLILFNPSTAQPVVALQSSAGIHALDPATGADVWSYTNGASTIASSTALDGVLLVPSHGVTALKPSPASPTPVQLWRSGQLRPGMASPVAWRGRVYVINSAGILTCGDAATGQRLWQLRLTGPVSATPIAAGHHLYCINENGLLQVVDLTAPEGAVVGRLDFQETILSTPSASTRALYVRSDRHLWKLAQPH